MIFNGSRLSLGKPIITTIDVPGCRQVVEDGFNGLLCQLQNAEDLAEKMLAMIELPEHMRQTLGKNGRIKMESEFSDRVIIKKYSNAMLEILLEGVLS
ncbi:MAG: glycosyltransferase [Cyclobacteriaceae bacterium]